MTKKWLRFKDIFQRRRRLIFITSVICLLGLLLTYQRATTLQRIEMRFIVGTSPLPVTTELEQERYYRWVGSEYEVYGISDWANGTTFASRVSERMLAFGFDEFDVETVDENMYAEAVRSRLLVGVVGDDEAEVEAMADAMLDVLLNKEGLEIPQFNLAEVVIFPIDEPILQEFEPPVADQLSLPLRLVLGLFSGFLLAGTVELFDPTIRYREALVDLQLPLLGEIPKG